MLIITLNETDNFVQIGRDIRVYYQPRAGRHAPEQIQLGIEAPRNVNIIRRKVLERDLLERK